MTAVETEDYKRFVPPYKQMYKEREGSLIVVGLTGGIGSGKSTISKHLKDKSGEFVEKYLSTAGSFFEKRCSIVKSILRFGMNRAQIAVIPPIIVRVFFGFESIQRNIRSIMIQKNYL